MSTVSQLSTQEEVYESASLWIARMDRGLSAVEEEQLKQWLSASDANRDVLLSMTQQWDEMDALSCLTDIFPDAAPKKSSSSRLPAFAIAASIVFATVVGTIGFALLGKHIETEPFEASALVVKNSGYEPVSYETAIGEQSSVVLSDGTSILLNTNTLVSVAYTPEERFIRLHRGELNVDVAHNPLRPLKVATSEHVVEAIGTAFNMKMTGLHDVELLVTDGKVLVVELETSVVQQDFVRRSVAVSAGEEFLLGSEEATLNRIAPEDIEVKLSWREGNLIFRGESLQMAMAEVGRYTSTEFVFLDDTARTVRIAGRFKAGDLDELLATLEDSFNVSSYQVGESRIELASH